MILPCASGAHSFFSSATVIVEAQVFFGIHDDREAVVGDRQLDVLDAGLLAGLDFGGADRTRGVADVGLAAAELLEPAAGAGDADGDPDAFVGLLELLGDGLADREDRARPVDLDHRRGGRGVRLGAGVTAAATAGEEENEAQREDCPAEADGRRRT